MLFSLFNLFVGLLEFSNLLRAVQLEIVDLDLNPGFLIFHSLLCHMCD